MNAGRQVCGGGGPPFRGLGRGEYRPSGGRFCGANHGLLTGRRSERPPPPIWVAAIATEESFVNAARNGHHIMIVPYAGGLERTSNLVKVYRRMWKESGHAPGQEQVQMAFHAYVAETHAEAVQGYVPA